MDTDQRRPLTYQEGDFVEVKQIGLAKVDAVGDTEYFLFFASGKRGGGWKEHDIAGPTTKQKFWADWRARKRYG